MTATGSLCEIKLRIGVSMVVWIQNGFYFTAFLPSFERISLYYIATYLYCFLNNKADLDLHWRNSWRFLKEAIVPESQRWSWWVAHEMRHLEWVEKLLIRAPESVDELDPILQVKSFLISETDYSSFTLLKQRWSPPSSAGWLHKHFFFSALHVHEHVNELDFHLPMMRCCFFVRWLDIIPQMWAPKLWPTHVISSILLPT